MSPFFSAFASVNAPRSCPKSSLSRSAAGIAVQVTFMNGSRARSDS